MENLKAKAVNSIFSDRNWRQYISAADMPRMLREFKAWKKSQKKEGK